MTLQSPLPTTYTAVPPRLASLWLQLLLLPQVRRHPAPAPRSLFLTTTRIFPLKHKSHPPTPPLTQVRGSSPSLSFSSLNMESALYPRGRPPVIPAPGPLHCLSPLPSLFAICSAQPFPLFCCLQRPLLCSLPVSVPTLLDLSPLHLAPYGSTA